MEGNCDRRVSGRSVYNRDFCKIGGDGTMIMTSREIIISVLREHLISRKVAGKITDEIIKRTNADYERQVKKAGLEVK